MNRIKRVLLIIGGSLATGLGILGIFLPVLPTTPFLLLAAYCFMRSSAKMHHWLMHHKVLGLYIHDYITYHAVRKKIKVSAIILLWVMLTISFLVVDITAVRIFLVLVGLAVTTHILLLKTMTSDMVEPAEDGSVENDTDSDP